MNHLDFLHRELDIIRRVRDFGHLPEGDPSGNGLMIGHNESELQQLTELVTTLSSQFHVPVTRRMVVNAFERIAHELPLTPLTGADTEWKLPFEGDSSFYINRRCPRVFRRPDGRCYDAMGVVISGIDDPEDAEPIEFPYYPKMIRPSTTDTEDDSADNTTFADDVVCDDDFPTTFREVLMTVRSWLSSIFSSNKMTRPAD